MSPLRRLVVALALSAATLLTSASAASAAASVAYLDGKEVWVSSLDGSQKLRLSNGEGDWTAVAQNDNGWIVGIQLEAGKIAQLSRFTVWNPQGSVAYRGPLASAPGSSSYAFPLGLSVTAEGRGIVYGTSEYTYGFPVGSLRTGFYILPSETVVAPALGPIYVGSAEWVTLGPGDRVVGTTGKRTIGVQKAGSLAEPGFDDWFDLGGNPANYSFDDLDVSGDGTVVAATVADEQSGSSDYPTYVALAKFTAFGPPTGLYVDDCYIERQSSTRARNPSVSPDGTRVAWQDGGGVKVAGVPNFASGGPATCQLSAPPLTISASGSYPSIGGFDVAALIAARAPAPTPSPAPGTGSTSGGTSGGSTGGSTGGGSGGTLSTPTVTSTPKASTAPASGVPLTITLNATGEAKLKLTILPKALGLKGSKPIQIGTASGTVTAGQPTTFKVKLTARGKQLRKRLKGKRAKLLVTVGGQSATITIKLG